MGLMLDPITERAETIRKPIITHQKATIIHTPARKALKGLSGKI